MTLITTQGRGGYPSLTRSYPVRDVQSLGQLTRRYAAYGPHRRARPWTQAETLVLGHLYTQAYGVLPTQNRCRARLSMPDAQTITRLWGTFAAWIAALYDVLPMCEAIEENGRCQGHSQAPLP